MKRYEIPMTESRCSATTYWVDARNPEEALEKALIGDTTDESEGRVGEVIDREAVGPVTRIPFYVRTLSNTKQH